MIGQSQVDKYDCHVICRSLSYLPANNWMSYWLAELRCQHVEPTFSLKSIYFFHKSNMSVNFEMSKVAPYSFKQNTIESTLTVIFWLFLVCGTYKDETWQQYVSTIDI